MPRLEPAGSHGVWGMDDYQFLPFLWGAAQLVGHPHIRPRSILSAETLEACSADYMYLAAVKFVRHVRPYSTRLHVSLGVPSQWLPVACSIDTAPCVERPAWQNACTLPL